MRLVQKTASEIHRDLVASGIFLRATQKMIAVKIGVNQGTISRIQNGNFRRVNKTVRALCNYAEISISRTTGVDELRSLVSSAKEVQDPTKKKLIDIIELAVELLERP
jgi:hypothetical protein